MRAPKELVRRARAAALYRGSARYCPCCDRTSRRFLPYGRPRRPEAICPWCGSLERHRVLWLVLRDALQPDDAVLHVAPEVILGRNLRRLGVSYTSVDRYAPADVAADITKPTPFAASSFDAIICSHVLEHVDDDRAAMLELRRLLRPGGTLFVLVPLDWERTETDEDPSVTAPADRLRRFGQEDHVRAYGPDLVDRLTAAGFAVEERRVDDVADAEDRQRMSIPRRGDETVFVCTPSLSRSEPT